MLNCFPLPQFTVLGNNYLTFYTKYDRILSKTIVYYQILVSVLVIQNIENVCTNALPFTMSGYDNLINTLQFKHLIISILHSLRP